MLKSKWLYSLIALFVVFLSLTAFIGEYDSEKDLIKAADKHFEAGEYAKCLDLYATLVSNHPQDPNFNYKYGACKLFATDDKIGSLVYLKLATKNQGATDAESYYFYGVALQQNYEFDAAVKQYKMFKSLVKTKESEEKNISNLIKQCSTAKEKIRDFKKMDVVYKKSVGKQEFFRSYRLGSMKRSIIITPEEFLVSADKKSGDYSLIVHHPMNEVIYFSSYNKDGNIGGKDIFKIQKMPDGTFSDPVNLGPSVNSREDEDYPYLHPNGRVLYFASKGRGGIGGYDIFKSELDTNTNIWGMAENVGFSINSPADDILYVSDMDENIAYFASDRGDKSGKITVYKILPNKSDIPVVIVRGQVEIEGSRNHTANISIYNSDGEELAQYKSQHSGHFVMTLNESTNYTVGVSAPGRGEAKSQLDVPARAVSDMLSKKFVITSNGLDVDEGDELFATAEAKNKLLRQSAQLEVNQTDDVDFNTKIERPKTSANSAGNDLTDRSEEDNNPVNETIENATAEENILADAEEELQEIKASLEKVEKQIDATYHVANKKKIKAELIKDEIGELSEELESVFTEEEKESLQRQLNDKRTELKANASSAAKALELAKAKEREFEVKKKQEELAQTYVDAVKNANESNNGSKAIADLERARDELDKIQDEIKQVQQKDGSAETIAKADAAKKKVADFEVKQSVLEKDVSDIEQQRTDLEAQIKSTKNKGQKEELNLQLKELDEELAEINVESRVNLSKLEEAKSEYEVYNSNQDVYDEVYEEANDGSLVKMSKEQKESIAIDVNVQKASVEKTLKESAVKEEKEDELEVKGVESATSDELSAEDIKQKNSELDENAKVTPERQYSDEVAKAELEKETLVAVREEIELLELAKSGDIEKRQKQEIEEKLIGLRADEKKSVEDLRKYVDQAKVLEKDLPKSAVANQKTKVDALEDLSTEVAEFEKEIVAIENSKTETTEGTPKTIPLTFDEETASDNEVNALLDENSGIRNVDFQLETDNADVEKLEGKSADLERAALKDLIEANKQQVEFENNGGEGIAPKAEKLKKQALQKQFESAEIQGEANEKQYEAIRDELERSMYSDKGVATEELKEQSKNVTDKWIAADVRREQANNSKDDKEKTRLINEANELEHEALELQDDFKKAVVARQESLIANVDINNEKESTDNSGESTNVDVATKTEGEQIVNDGPKKEGGVDDLVDNKKGTDEKDNLNDDSIDVISEGSKDGIDNKESLATEEVIDPSTSNDPNEIRVVSPEEFNKDRPSPMATKYGNKEGYGIERNDDFAYGNSESVRQSKEEAKEAEKVALDYFYQSEALKEEASENPDKAKKLEKEVEKLLAKGEKAQDKANDKYAELNKSELDFNRSEVEFALEYNEIEKKDSAKIILEQADELFEEAQELRKEASKAKTKDKKADLINEAFAMEQEAIEQQNYIISGELDGENSEIEEEVVVVIPVREENEYTRKADALRAQADAEQDEDKKRALFEEARDNELAGNSKRTNRLLGELNGDKQTYENNKQIVITSREQSHNNIPANKGWKYEQEADSLFKIADDIRVKAANNTDEVERLKQITAANEYMAEAKEKQATAIRKYGESKSAPDEAGLVVAFRVDSVKEQLAKDEKGKGVEDVVVDSGLQTDGTTQDDIVTNGRTTTEKTSMDQGKDEVVAVDVDESGSEDDNSGDSTVDDSPYEEEVIAGNPNNNGTNIDEEIKDEVDLPVDNTQDDETNYVEDDSQDGEQQVTVMDPSKDEEESAEKAYTSLIKDSEEAEAQEVGRVENIVHLKNQAGINRNKSEELLAQVDGLSNENDIMDKLAEANKYRDLADEQEVEAKNQELILSNNIAEARAKRKEAELILAAIDESKQEDIKAAAQSDNEDLKKVREFLGDKLEEKPKEVETGVGPDIIVVNDRPKEEDVPEINDDSVVPNDVTPVNTNDNSGIDMDKISLLDDGGTENSIEDEFVMDPNKTYDASSEIPIDPEMPKGIIYQVQVGAFRQTIDPSIFNGLSPLVGEDAGNGIIRYKVGYFRGFKSANMAKGRIRKLGYPDAFVVVFYDGKRISLDKADEVIDAADDSEKFIYENLVQDEVQKLKSLGISEEEGLEDPETSVTGPSVVVVNPNTGAGANTGTGNQSQADNGLNNDLLKISGLFYTVQVGVFSTPKISSDLKGVTPLYTEKTSNGYLRYTTGVYRDFDSADDRKDAVRNQGVKDAFVTAYKDNQRISASQARNEERSDNNASVNSGSNKQGDSSSDNAEVVFKVQVGAYRAPITVESTPVFKDLTDYEISNIKTSSGLLIYMVGNYKTKAEADKIRQVVVNAGGKDCFVVALVNGKRISMSQALQIVK